MEAFFIVSEVKFYLQNVFDALLFFGLMILTIKLLAVASIISQRILLFLALSEPFSLNLVDCNPKFNIMTIALLFLL